MTLAGARDLGVAAAGDVVVESEHLDDARQRGGRGFGVDGEAEGTGHADSCDGDDSNGRASTRPQREAGRLIRIATCRAVSMDHVVSDPRLLRKVPRQALRHGGRQA